MRKLTPYLVPLLLGIAVGYFAAFGYFRSTVMDVRASDFYKGMIVFCAFAPAEPGLTGNSLYTTDDCMDMVKQAKDAKYFEQTLVSK